MTRSFLQNVLHTTGALKNSQLTCGEAHGI
jgi:hypothetical protein